jgi:MinD superfamily P-loop ATPase
MLKIFTSTEEHKKMRLIASTGGKGGTGKSTFAILLAVKLSKQGQKVLLCDCDVECPNDYLLLGKEITKPSPIYQDFPELDKEKCLSCGSCSKVCRDNAIFWIKGKNPIFFYDLCNGCGACWISCPNDAIKIKKDPIGESFITNVNNKLVLFTGRSKPGVAETGAIVREVKKRALNFANKNDIDILIIDTSPGAHCNVIQALFGCEMAYVVTEPTPLGAHDSKLILELLQIMGIHKEIVLNKADVGKKEVIQRIANEYKVPISLEIPYSDRLVRAYSSGKLEEVVDLI